MPHLEASDITKLLSELAYKHGDATCHSLAALAEHSHISVLELAHLAISTLVAEKVHLLKIACDLHALLPPPPIIVRRDSPPSDS